MSCKKDFQSWMDMMDIKKNCGCIQNRNEWNKKLLRSRWGGECKNCT